MKFSIIMSMICSLLLIAMGLIAVSCGQQEKLDEMTTVVDTTTPYDTSFIPSPEVEFVYVVDHESYYHENEMCGAINTLIGFSRMHKDLAIQLKFKPCEICCK